MTCAGGCAPTNSPTSLPSLNALTAGMPWIRKAAEICWLASVSSLARSMSGSRLRTSSSSTGVSWRQGPHHSAQKSTTTGTSLERSITSCSNVASVTSRITTSSIEIAVQANGPPAHGAPVLLMGFGPDGAFTMDSIKNALGTTAPTKKTTEK